MSQQIPVFVISLARSLERRARIAARMQELGLGFSFFDAVEGKLLDTENLASYDGRRRRLFFGRDLTASEIGCLLSHRGVYGKMIAGDIPAALILEDDAILQDDLPAVLAALPALRQDSGWELVRFLGHDKIRRQVRVLRPLFGDYKLCRAYGTPGGAYGYVLSQAGARKLARAMRVNWVPVDVLHGQSWRTGMEVYAVVASPVLPDYDVPSTMPPERFDKTTALRGWEKPAYLATRFGFKVYEAFGKRLSQLCSWWRDRKRFGKNPHQETAA